MTYRYTINGLDVTPEGDWTISNDQNEGQIFFRRNLSGELTFRGADYDLIMGFADCDVLDFIIYCGTSVFWEGQFKNPYDFNIDEDSCALTGTPEVVDEYSCIMDHYDTKYQVTGGITVVAPIINDCAGGALHTLPNCAPLGIPGAGTNGYLNNLLNSTSRLDCGLTLASSFLWRDNFPNGTNYAGAYGTNNYITGAANRLEYVYLGTNTSFRASLGGTLCDGVAYFTFKDFEDLLRIWFNAYWYIDQNGAFRIEHIHFFDADFPESDFEVGLNLKTLISNNGHSYAFRRNKYTYETGILYDQERWSMQHFDGTEGGAAHGSDFQGEPVFYGSAEDQKSDCVPGEFKEKELSTPRFWSDITWGWAIRANPPAAGGTAQPDTIGCPGFCVLDVDTVSVPVNHIRCETGAFSGGNAMNNHLSIANLQDHYHQYDRIFLDGDMNFGGSSPVTTFQTEIRKQLQEAIEFERCCSTEFDPLDFVETELGAGKVKAATEKKRSIEIELLY